MWTATKRTAQLYTTEEFLLKKNETSGALEIKSEESLYQIKLRPSLLKEASGTGEGRLRERPESRKARIGSE